jgi:hypothetical protein
MDALLGLPLKNFWKLLSENKFKIDSQYLPRVLDLFYLACRNSFFLRQENKIYNDQTKKPEILPPVFVLGHWRSGTTLLHSLLSLDDQFAYPTLFQVSKPYIFLCREPIVEKVFANVTAQKRAMDNIVVSFNSPGEDEFALAVGSLRSPLIGWSFPNRGEYYDRYLSLKDISVKELEEWKKFFIWFMQKLSYRYPGKPLILKSPTHTSRIKTILDIFPQTKFIHIHRNPYDVFRSTRKLYQELISSETNLQKFNKETIDSEILRRYRLMYEAFFEDRKLIPSGNYYEICYEDLEINKYTEIEKIYHSLKFSGFDQYSLKLIEYLETIKEYKKNAYEPLEATIKEKVYESCKSSFIEWGYVG